MTIGTPVLIGSAAHVQTSTGLTITVGAGGVPAGCDIVVLLNGVGALTNISAGDSSLNSYGVDVAPAAFSNMQSKVFRAANVSALAQNDTITVSWDSNAGSKSIIGLYATHDNDLELDGTPVTAENTADATPTSGNKATTVDDVLRLGLIAWRDAAGSFDTEDADFTALGEAGEGSAGGTGRSVHAAHRIVTASETNEYAPTISAEDSICFLVDYREASGSVQKSASDSATLATVEGPSLDVTLSRVDSVIVAMAETADPSVLLQVSDSAAVALVEAVSAQVTLARGESLLVATSEAGSLIGRLVRSDSAAVVLGESSAPRVVVATADSLPALLAEGATLSVVVAVADSLAISLDEAALLLVALARGETASLALADSAAVRAMLSAVDSATLATLETSAPRAIVAVSELLSVSLAEAAAILGTMQRADLASLALDDAAVIRRLLGVGDELRPLLQDLADLTQIAAVLSRIRLEGAIGRPVLLGSAAVPVLQGAIGRPRLAGSVV